MKRNILKPVAISIAVFFTAFSVQAQTKFTLPEDIELNSAEDYKDHEQTVVEASKWLVETSMDKAKTKRAKINLFILKWSMGTPTVTITLSNGLTKLFNDNTDLFAIYMASYCRYCIENETDKKPKKAAAAALTDVNEVYQKGIDVKKSKGLEKLKKQIDAGTLSDYVETLLK